jgi:hypothetical protein
MRTRFRDGGLYYMGGKYGMGGMYPSFNDAGQFNGNGNGDPKKIKSANTNNIDFNSGDDTVKSTRTYTEGETTGEFTDFAPVPAYRKAMKQGKEISATEALLDRLSQSKVQTRLVDEKGREIKDESDYTRYIERQKEALKKGFSSGDIDRKTFEKQYELLQGEASAFPEYVQAQGENEATRNIYGRVSEAKDPEAVVEKRLEGESHWFNKNDPKFGPGGFNVHNPGHVMEYQMMYNQLAAPGEEITVDGKWGEQTQSATVPIRESEREELAGGVDPELEMRLYQEKPSGGWDQEETGGGGSSGGGYGGYTTGRVRKGGGGGGGGCVGKSCAAYGRAGGGRYNLGGIMKTKFKDGGVYYMR